MGSGARRVMSIGTKISPALLIEFEFGRQAEIRHFGWECPFSMVINDVSGHARFIKVESDFFASFIRNLVQFFETSIPAVYEAETVAIITIIEYGLKAAATPHQWVELPD